MANIPELIETVKSMTVLELNEFVKALQEEFGVSAMAMAAPAAAAGCRLLQAVEERRPRSTSFLPPPATRRSRSSRSSASSPALV